MLERSGAVFDDPADAVDVYTRQSSLVTTRDLAVMGATLADGGVNPVTGMRVVDASVCRYTLAVMTTVGTFAPRLDDAGNSVKGQLVARFLSCRLGLDLFVSQPSVQR